MRLELERGFVLHSRPYRDSSLLVEFFSRERGRISLVTRGAKGRRTRGGSLAALLQVFNPVACSWYGRGELKTLTACESLGRSFRLAGARLYSGLYVNELLVRMLHHEDPHQRLFEEYRRALEALQADGDEETVLRRFEFALLEELGYGFDLEIDGLSGDPVQADRWYDYHRDYGLVLAAGVGECRPRYKGADIKQFGAGRTSDAARRCAKRLMRQALSGHLGDRPLKSRELFRPPS